MKRFAGTACPAFFLVTLAVIFYSTSALSEKEEGASAQDPTSRLVQYMTNAYTEYEKIESYESFVLLTEQHKGKIRDTERVRHAFKRGSLKLYFHWQEGGPFDGLQVSYDEKRDGPNHFMALESGFRGIIGVKRWHFESIFVTKLYPHTFHTNQYHLGFLLKYSRSVFEKALGMNMATVTDLGMKPNPYLKRPMRVFRIEFSPNPADGLPYKSSRIGFDEKTGLPLHIETFGFDDQLSASYIFSEFDTEKNIDPSLFELKKLP